MSEQVNHPQHYGGEDNPYEAIKVVEAWNLGFCLGNVVKYISRAGKKDAGKVLEDLKKSAWYLQREIQKLEGEEKSKALADLLNKSIKGHPIERPLPEIKLGPTIYPGGGLIPSPEFPRVFGDGAAFCGGVDPLYCTDLNKHTAPILTAHDPEETLASGSTNRLKPVEDKAEIWITNVNSAAPSPAFKKAVLDVVQDAVAKNVRPKAKTLDEAY